MRNSTNCSPTNPTKVKKGKTMAAKTPVTVVMLPDGTWDTSDNVRTATITDGVFTALIGNSSEDRPVTPALKEYMEQHGSFMDE